MTKVKTKQVAGQLIDNDVPPTISQAGIDDYIVGGERSSGIPIDTLHTVATNQGVNCRVLKFEFF